jgi:hypothetical protein
MTLKELIEKHGLPVKVRRAFWDKHEWVQWIAISEINAIGFDDHGKGYTDDMLATGYTPYTEPKQKTVYYQAVAQTVSGAKVVAPNLFTDAESAEDFLGTEFVKLLTDRPIEV